MTLNDTDRDLLIGLIDEPDSVEMFAIDNRDALHALNVLVLEYQKRRGDVEGRRPPVSNVKLQGGLDQVGVLRELVRECGLESIDMADSMTVFVPGHRSYGFEVELPAATAQFSTTSARSI